MKFTITCISKNRFMGKAYRRIYPELKKLSLDMEEKFSEICEVDCVEFWLVDRPLEYLEIAKRTKDLIEIHAGIDGTLNFTSDEDPKFLNSIRGSLERVVKLLGF